MVDAVITLRVKRQAGLKITDAMLAVVILGRKLELLMAPMIVVTPQTFVQAGIVLEVRVYLPQRRGRRRGVFVLKTSV